MQTTISKSIALLVAVTHAVRMAELSPDLGAADADDIEATLKNDYTGDDLCKITH
jgi:hypothetical protein